MRKKTFAYCIVLFCLFWSTNSCYALSTTQTNTTVSLLSICRIELKECGWTCVSFGRNKDRWNITGRGSSFDDVADIDIEQEKVVVDTNVLQPSPLYTAYSAKHLQLSDVFPPINHIVIDGHLWLKEKNILSNVSGIRFKPYQCVGFEQLAHLSEFPKLRLLNLANTEIDDNSLVHLKFLRRLEELNLNGNPKITDKGVVQLRTLNSLRKLDLKGTHTTRASLSVLQELPRLETLAVTWNLGNRTISDSSVFDLSLFPRLTSLDIGSYSGGTTNTPIVRHSKQLQKIKLSIYANDKLIIPEWIKTIPSIELKIVFEPSWKAENIDSLKSLTNLSVVSLEGDQGCDINPCLSFLDGITSIHALEMSSYCGVIPVSSDGMKQLSKFNQLESLTLVLNPELTIMTNPAMKDGVDTSALRSLVGLKSLEMRIVNEHQLEFLTELRQLRLLSLPLCSDIKSFDVVIEYLQNMDQLADLRIGVTEISDIGLSKLINLRKLQRLDLTNCTGYTDAGLAKLMDESPSLQTVIRSYGPEKKGE